MKEIKNCFINYFNFHGKSARKEFLFFLLFRLALFVILEFCKAYLESRFDIEDEITYALLILFWLGTLIPMAAVGVRRLHDLGRSGWWYLIVLIPLANLIFFFSLAAVPGATNERASARGCFIAALVCSLLPPLLLLLLPLSLLMHDIAKEEFGKIKIRAMLRSMYRYLDDYRKEYGAYPMIDPDNYGVKDLYPLFENGKASPKRLKALLQPTGRKYKEFSSELTIDDFDPDHIGWYYNPKARPDSDDPLLGEHYHDMVMADIFAMISSESLVDSNPNCINKQGVTVLLANGRIVYIKYIKEDNVNTNVVQNWDVLKK